MQSKLSDIMYDYDVCIVGGGPSGVITAYSVAKAGYKCIILDKKSRELIGDKNCGDALDGLYTDIIHEKLGIEPPSVELGEARDLIKFFTIAAGTLENKLSAQTPGYLVNRLVYGQRLLKDAEKIGVEILPEVSVRNVLLKNKHIVGVEYFDKEGNKNQIRSKITVDASGIMGVVRKAIPELLKNDIEYNFMNKHVIKTYREIIKLQSDKDHKYREEIVLFYPPEIKPPGYIWIFSEGPKMLNIGIAWVKSDPYPVGKSMKKLFHEHLDKYFPPDSYEVIHKGGGNIPMRPNFDSLVYNGAMLVGDAAGAVDPTSFEGHGPALDSGRMAGNAIISSLKANSFTKEDLWQYNIDFMKYPGAMHMESFIASQMTRAVGVNNLEFLLNRKIITEEILRNMFQEKESVISNFTLLKMFLKAFPRWPMMFKLRKYMVRIEKVEDIYKKYPNSPDKLEEWRNYRNKELKMNF